MMRKGYYRLREFDGDHALIPLDKIERHDHLDHRMNNEEMSDKEMMKLYDEWVKIFEVHKINEAVLKDYVIAVMDSKDKVP